MKFLKPLLLILLLPLTVICAFAQSSTELRRRKKALASEIFFLNRSIKQTSNNKQLSLRQISILNSEIELREEKISTINSEIRLLNEEISDNTGTVKLLKSDLERLRKEYAAMVVFAFRNKGAYGKLVFVFAATDFNQGYKRLKYLNQFGKYRKKQASYIRQTQQNLNIKIAQLGNNKKEKSNLLQEKKEEKTSLGNKKEEQAQVLTKLSKQEEKLRQQLSKKKNESTRLKLAIRSAINREIELARKREAARIASAVRVRKLAEARSTSSKSLGKSLAKPANETKSANALSSTPESAKLSSGFLDNRGNLPWPVSIGSIVESFGTHNYGVNVTLENNGIDIKTIVGAPVRSVFVGEVSTVQNIGGSYAVLIRHGEYFTVYSNLKSSGVSRGQKVSIRQSIGTVLTNSDGSTLLHFEIRKGASPLNPTSWLSR